MKKIDEAKARLGLLNVVALEARIANMPRLITREELLEAEIKALHKLLDERDELLDVLQGPSAWDWLAIVALIACAVGAGFL